MSHELLDLLDGYQPMPVAYQLRGSILQKIRRGEDPLPEIQGREETKRDVLRALLSGHNIYLVSEEGTGKTRLAKSLTRLLPPILKVRGCPYNDDPKWPSHWLCPRCRESRSPAEEYGIEMVPGEKRFSRIQGNDYTDESKLLGLKDIQAIVKGRSPTDIHAFAATGAFRANRGILFIDELPAIRTKVQVLLHPISEEKKAILEEYNWEYPLDNVLIATGNPEGFSHINEVPRPLLDRLELIYMPLPGPEVEREIMLGERFRIKGEFFEADGKPQALWPSIRLEELERDVVLPWWVLYLLTGAIHYSRRCSLLDRRPSIRASYRALDHAYAGAELEGRKVASLQDAWVGLRLALRGRIELRSDLIDFENPRENFTRSDELSQDLLWNALEGSKELFLEGCHRERLAEDIGSLASEGVGNLSHRLPRYGELHRAIERIKRVAGEKVNRGLLNQRERELLDTPAQVDIETLDQYHFSALETLCNAALCHQWISEEAIPWIPFIPRLVSWSRPLRGI